MRSQTSFEGIRFRLLQQLLRDEFFFAKTRREKLAIGAAFRDYFFFN